MVMKILLPVLLIALVGFHGADGASQRDVPDMIVILVDGCDVAWDGVLPKYCVPYDFNAANSHYFVKQLHQALDMIQGEDYQLIMLYTGGVDRQGHYYGPDSAEVAASVGEVDAVLQGLWEALETREMYNSTNVVILSDHGMTYTLPKDLEFVDIAPCIDRGQLLSTTEYGSYVNILPAPGYEQQVAEDLRKCPDINDKVEVYLKDELDERYHYRSHRLIHEIMVIAKPGVYIRAFDEAFAVPAHAPIYVADHGYDNTFNQNPNMRGILYATGPSFAKGVEVGPVEQVDVYGLLCRALQLSSCHPHNGTMSRVEDFFMKTETSISPTFWEFSLVAFTLLFSLFILSLTSVLWR